MPGIYRHRIQRLDRLASGGMGMVAALMIPMVILAATMTYAGTVRPEPGIVELASETVRGPLMPYIIDVRGSTEPIKEVPLDHFGKLPPCAGEKSCTLYSDGSYYSYDGCNGSRCNAYGVCFVTAVYCPRDWRDQ